MNIEQIWLDYQSRIKSFLHSKVSNPADVDDLLQEISIKTFAGLSQLEDHTKVQQWLFQTAHRTIIDFYRKNGRVKDVSPDDLWYQKDDPDTLQSLERCVEPFLNALPEETAKLLTAVDIDGQSQKAYAAEHGLAYSTLKSRLKSGRSDLRRVFENCCRMKLDAHGNIMDYQPKSDNCQNC
ncbi:MAG: RNA polymerase sigma factor SigZ [Rhizobiaceae bacterium]|nr:RNA polymerase sigma factor SigZ [Rhizobiaceae bacterium]